MINEENKAGGTNMTNKKELEFSEQMLRDVLIIKETIQIPSQRLLNLG